MASIDRILLIPAATRGESHGVDEFAHAVAYEIQQATDEFKTLVEARLATEVPQSKTVPRLQSKLRHSIPPLIWRTTRTQHDLDIFFTPKASSLREECVAFGESTSNAYRVFATGSLDVDETALEIIRVAYTINDDARSASKPDQPHETAETSAEAEPADPVDIQAVPSRIADVELLPVAQFGEGAIFRLMRDTEALLVVADRMLDDQRIPKIDRDALESDVLAFHQSFDRPSGPLQPVLTGYITSIAAFVTRFSGVVDALRSVGSSEAAAGAELCP